MKTILSATHLVAILFLPFASFAQLSGKVLDENGEPLPFASVYVRNSTTGTTANADGEYRLPLSSGDYDIIFQYIGYKQHVEKVRIEKSPVRLNVRLEPSNLELSEVVITTEDPAMGIMRKVIERRRYYKTRVPDYSCDVYIKGFHKLLDAPKKILGQEVGDMEGILDTNRTGVLYLSESVSKLYVQSNPERTREVMISSKVSGNENGFSLNRATLTDFNLYDEHLEIDREILSPLADNAFNYYNFKLLGRYKDENGYDIYKISVLPKRKSDPTFSGDLYVVDEWWNLAGANLVLTGDAIKTTHTGHPAHRAGVCARRTARQVVPSLTGDEPSNSAFSGLPFRGYSIAFFQATTLSRSTTTTFLHGKPSKSKMPHRNATAPTGPRCAPCP